MHLLQALAALVHASLRLAEIAAQVVLAVNAALILLVRQTGRADLLPAFANGLTRSTSLLIKLSLQLPVDGLMTLKFLFLARDVQLELFHFLGQALNLVALILHNYLVRLLNDVIGTVFLDKGPGDFRLVYLL